MFEKCSVMVMCADSEQHIRKLEVTAETQEAICVTFSDAVGELTADKEKVDFDGSYKPDRDEFLCITNFRLPDEIKDAIRNPLGVSPYESSEGDYPEIKALFVGTYAEDGDTEKFYVAFQRFRKEQYISPKFINLFFSSNTFRREENFGISISDCVDCYYENDELQFSSFYFARQIFDLNGYYRSATNKEVAAFTANDTLSFENADGFEALANTSIRRKIAMINDSGVLAEHTAVEIRKLARQTGISIEVKDKKIVIPDDKEQIKLILGFLDEEAYKGPFSQETYLANSKRKVQKK